MIDASFSMPINVIANTTFNGTLTFAGDVTLFDEMDITLTAVDGNGITGVSFTVTQQTASTYAINFTLPADAEGAFSVEATGTVLPDGETVAVDINANPAAPVVTYDTSVAVAATWGTAVYVGDGTVEIPITFASDVVVVGAAVFQVLAVAPLTDADLAGLTWVVNGDGTDWTLTVTLPADANGSLSIDIVGEVFKTTTHVWDTVTIAALTLDFDTREPFIENYDVPATYTPGQIFNVRVAFNVLVTGWHVNNTLTEIFIEEGARLGGTELPYKWTGSSPPDFTAAVPDDLSGTDWQLLATPPAGQPTPGSNGFDENGQWHGESGQYFLIRWTVQSGVTGAFNLSQRIGGVRGPVS